MEVFGWICLVVLALFGIFMIGLIIGPFVIAKIKSFGYKIKCYYEDEKLDSDKRSEDRKNRDEILRAKKIELANKKLEVKLNKVDKQIKLQTEKLELAKQLKKQTVEEIEELETVRPKHRMRTEEKPKIEHINLNKPLSEQLQVQEQTEQNQE